MSLKNKNEYQIGDKVITCGSAVYENVTETFVPDGSIGTIIKIRHRYENTINEHKQYKVKLTLTKPIGKLLLHKKNY